MRYLRAVELSAWRGALQLERHVAAGAGRRAGARGPGATTSALDALRFMADRHHLRGPHHAGAPAARRPRRLSGQRHPREVRSHVDGARARGAGAVSRRRPGGVRVAIAGASQGRPRGPGQAHPARAGREDLRRQLSRAKKQGFSIPVHEWLRGPARPLVDDLLSPSSLSAVPELNAPAIAACRLGSPLRPPRVWVGVVGVDGAGGVAPPAYSAPAERPATTRPEQVDVPLVAR